MSDLKKKKKKKKKKKPKLCVPLFPREFKFEENFKIPLSQIASPSHINLHPLLPYPTHPTVFLVNDEKQPNNLET